MIHANMHDFRRMLGCIGDAGSALLSAAHIIVAGRTLDTLTTTKTEIEALAPTCRLTPVPVDLLSEPSVAQLFATLPLSSSSSSSSSSSRPLVPDVVINNAGISLDASPIADSDPTTWWRNWEVNVKGTYLFTRAYLHALKGQGNSGDADGRVIINVSSSLSDMVTPNMSSYGTSKTAVDRFTEAVQLEYGGRSQSLLGPLRCLAFHPGGIASTGMGQAAPEQFRDGLIDTVDLAAGTALYLSTPAAGYLDGRYMHSNWDMEEMEKFRERILGEDLLVSRIRYGVCSVRKFRHSLFPIVWGGVLNVKSVVELGRDKYLCGVFASLELGLWHQAR